MAHPAHPGTTGLCYEDFLDFFHPNNLKKGVDKSPKLTKDDFTTS